MTSNDAEPLIPQVLTGISARLVRHPSEPKPLTASKEADSIHREDSCSISTDKVEVQPAIDLIEYNRLRPAHGGGKSGG